MTPDELRQHFMAALLLLMRGCEAEGMEPTVMADVLDEVMCEIHDSQQLKESVGPATVEGEFEQVSSGPTLATS